ncbi:MAG: histidine--tRNA ligase [Pseudomonadales bacterium]
MLQTVRGMRVVLPPEARRFRHVEDTVRGVLARFAYEEVQLPLLEATELFSRGVGEATDIVEKEMYTLQDRDGNGIALRPEGTAGCVRALEEAGYLYNKVQRVFYTGPMFRYERPQKGRYRQFTQIGAEAFGFRGPDVDVELLAIGHACWRALGLQDAVWLELNTLGSREARLAYRAALVAYLSPYAAELDADSRRRLTTNPLRILDSKDARTRDILTQAPRLPDFVDKASLEDFDRLQQLLSDLGIAYRLNAALVRGLDYYTHTVFEWVTHRLGAQGTVCAGGRYDGLVETLGGCSTPAAGFGMGLDRVVLLHEAVCADRIDTGCSADVFICIQAPEMTGDAMRLADEIREACPDLRVRAGLGGAKLKAQFRKADDSGARWAVIVGADELARGAFTLKPLRAGDGEQMELTAAALIAHVARGR